MDAVTIVNVVEAVVVLLTMTCFVNSTFVDPTIPILSLMANTETMYVPMSSTEMVTGVCISVLWPV